MTGGLQGKLSCDRGGVTTQAQPAQGTKRPLAEAGLVSMVNLHTRVQIYDLYVKVYNRDAAKLGLRMFVSQPGQRGD